MLLMFDVCLQIKLGAVTSAAVKYFNGYSFLLLCPPLTDELSPTPLNGESASTSCHLSVVQRGWTASRPRRHAALHVSQKASLSSAKNRLKSGAVRSPEVNRNTAEHLKSRSQPISQSRTREPAARISLRKCSFVLRRPQAHLPSDWTLHFQTFRPLVASCSNTSRSRSSRSEQSKCC